jgi:hypothetical protein
VPQHLLPGPRSLGLLEDRAARHRLPARRARRSDRVRPGIQRLPLRAARLRSSLPPGGRQRPLLDRRGGAGLRALRRDASGERPQGMLRAPGQADAAGGAPAPRDRHGEAGSARAVPAGPGGNLAGRLRGSAAGASALHPIPPPRRPRGGAAAGPAVRLRPVRTGLDDARGGRGRRRYAIPRSFDANAFFRDTFGLFVGGGPAFRFRVRFSRDLSDEIREQQWHPKQKIEGAPGGEVVLELPARSIQEARRFVLQYGGDAMALSPPELVADLREQAERLADAYGRTKPGAGRREPRKKARS